MGGRIGPPSKRTLVITSLPAPCDLLAIPPFGTEILPVSMPYLLSWLDSVAWLTRPGPAVHTCPLNTVTSFCSFVLLTGLRKDAHRPTGTVPTRSPSSD